MKIPLAKLAPVAGVITQLKDALRQYCLAPDKIPVSLDDLGFAVEQLYSLPVITKKVAIETNFIQGAIEFFEDHIEIYIASHLDRQNRSLRFCKGAGPSDSARC